MIKKILITIAVLIILTITGITAAVMTFDVNKHREQIEAALGKEIGRTVKLGGDIHIGATKKGLTLSIKDVAFSNPSWASRPEMVSVKLFELKVGLMALLAHKLDIRGLAISDADILFETSKDNHHNWEMEIGNKPASAKTPSTATTIVPLDLQITDMSIKNSRIAIRNQDGVVTVFKTDDMTLSNDKGYTELRFDGSYNDMPIILGLTSDGQSLITTHTRPVDIDLNFSDYHIAAKGKIDIGHERADFDVYEVASGATILTGRMAAGWGGTRPAVQGTVTSQLLVLSDLKLAPRKVDGETVPAPANDKPDPRMFSATPLDLAALKSADVNLDLAIEDMPMGSVELHGIKGKLVINNGHLFLSPLVAGLGDGEIKGQLNLDAGQDPAKLGITFTVNDVDLGDIIKAGGAEAFLAGKVKADLNLASNGNSMHDQASNLSGTINLISAGGDVLSTANDKISSSLAQILSPGVGNSHDNMNCLVARFIALNGVIKGNGILVDTLAATAVGYGDIDLRGESIDLSFHAKPKLVNVGGLLPPLHIGGTLQAPSVTADGASFVQNVGQILAGGTINDNVPDIMTQQGQNACAYALDHPTTAAATRSVAQSRGGVVQDLAGQAGNLLKGFLGKQ